MEDFSHMVQPRPAREPFFNAPRSVVGLSILLLVIHEIRQWLSPEMDAELLVRLAFIPLRYSGEELSTALAGDGGLSMWLSPLTFGFLHGDWQHVMINVLWLVVFGSPVAWRFGNARFLLFSALCSMGGALAHYLAHANDLAPVIGASAAISGMTAAACRFVFEAGGPLGHFRLEGQSAFRQPARPFLRSLANRRVFAFVALWFALTIFFGAGGAPLGLQEGASIAWEAHLGGFIAGLVLFPLFDPVKQNVLVG